MERVAAGSFRPGFRARPGGAQAAPVHGRIRCGRRCPVSPAALAFLRLWVRKECLVKLGRITLDQLDSVDFSAFMQTESVAQAAVTHFAHQGLHYSEWLDPELRVVGTAVGDGPFDIHPFR